MITSGSTSPAMQQSQYFRNISSVKNRGAATTARPLSAILRPLVDTIKEGLEKMNRMGVRERERQTPSRDFEKRVTGSEAENMLNLSSDADSDDSLTYTASVFTIQVCVLRVPLCVSNRIT